MFSFDLDSIIVQINSRIWDPIHAVRVISNFYSQYKDNITDKDFAVLIKRKEDLNHSYYQNIYQLLIYLFSGRKKEYVPERFVPALLYTSGNWKPMYEETLGLKPPILDEDLLKFNFVCTLKEFA